MQRRRSDFRAFRFFNTQNPPRYFVDFPPLSNCYCCFHFLAGPQDPHAHTVCEHRAIHTAVSAATFGKLKGTTSS